MSPSSQAIVNPVIQPIPGAVSSYCTSCSWLLGLDVIGVRHALAGFLLDLGPERDAEASGGAAAALQVAVAGPGVDDRGRGAEALGDLAGGELAGAARGAGGDVVA